MQISSLNTMVQTFETQILKKLTGVNNEKRATHEHLCEVWRQKVFDTLVQKKRVELIAKQNLDKYNEVTNDLRQKYEESVKQLQMERDDAIDKMQVMDSKLLE